MTEPSNHEVVLWFQSRFSDFKQRGPVTQKQADSYNRAHPERPYTGPVRKTEAWLRGERLARDHLTWLSPLDRDRG